MAMVSVVNCQSTDGIMAQADRLGHRAAATWRRAAFIT